MPTSDGPKKKAFWNNWEKMIVSSIFSFSHDVFYLPENKFQFFIHISFVVCFEFGRVKNFVDW